ncbi:MAG: hypothetical protein IT347_13425 [Candidatus Eisenbacteria bacterium]|nr:hypothetical protein [Candidatus Eisenbacteria bacterium]
MTRRWLALVLLVFAGAAAFTIAGRLPRRAAAPESPPPPPPVEADTLVVAGDEAHPPRISAVLGHRLAITVINRGVAAAHLALSGYEHAFAPRSLAPGEARTDTLLLDLPGEDFAWMLDGRPAAQLHVAGSHLAEGHR